MLFESDPAISEMRMWTNAMQHLGGKQSGLNNNDFKINM